MHAITIVLLSLLLCASCASSDSDPAPEDQPAGAQAAAEREVEAEAERKMDQASAKQHAALIQDKRKWLGSAAVGKSDGDVERLYDQKIHVETDAAESAIGNGQRAMRDRRANEQMKAATGKSMQEIVNMSPEEQQEWVEEMEGHDGC